MPSSCAVFHSSDLTLAVRSAFTITVRPEEQQRQECTAGSLLGNGSDGIIIMIIIVMVVAVAVAPHSCTRAARLY